MVTHGTQLNSPLAFGIVFNSISVKLQAVYTVRQVLFLVCYPLEITVFSHKKPTVPRKSKFYDFN